jgi:hypothetical protein
MSCLHRDKDPCICKKTLEESGKHPWRMGATCLVYRALAHVIALPLSQSGLSLWIMPLTAFEDQSTPCMKVGLIRRLWCI